MRGHSILPRLGQQLLLAGLCCLAHEACPATWTVDPPPDDMGQPVLWVMQRGTDVAVEIRGNEHWLRKDLPNGAWGLEIVRPDGRPVRLWAGQDQPPRVETRWVDLDAVGPSLAEGMSHYIDAGDHYASHDATAAQSGWKQARELARISGDDQLALHAGYLQSLALRRLNLAEDAMGLVRSLIREFPGDRLAPTLHYSLGSTLFTLDRFDEALPVLETARRQAAANRDTYAYSVAARQRCFVIHRQRVDEALRCYRELEGDPRIQLHRHILGSVLEAHAAALEDSGQYRKAIEMFGEAIRVLTEAGSGRSRINALYNLANAQKQIGAYLQALGNYLQAFSFYRTTNRTRHVRLVSRAIADLYQQMGDPDLAEAWYRYAIDTQESPEQRRWVDLARIELANLYITRGRLEQADSVLGAVPPDIKADLALERRFVEVALSAERGNLASTDLDGVCEAARKSGYSDMVVRCSYWRVRSALARNDPEAAIQLATAAGEQSPPAHMAISLDLLAAQAVLGSGRFAEARSRGRKVINTLFELTAETPSWQIINLGQLHDAIWDLAMQAVLHDPELEPVDRARELWGFDRMRRRLVNRAFRREAELFSSPDISLAELNGWSEALLEGRDIPLEVSERLLRIDAADTVQSRLPDPPVRNRMPAVPTISYWLGSERSVALIAADGHVLPIELPPRPVIQAAVATAHRALVGGKRFGWERLEEAIWDPVVEDLPERGEIDILPDGILATVPFEIFDVQGEPALTRFSIAYSHGMTTGAEESTWKGTRGARLMVFANPDYAGRRPSLQHSVGEVEVARRNFRSVRAITGTEATRSALLSPPPSRTVPDILHVAAHGRWDLDYPAHSGLWMAEPDGFVSVRELATSRWPTELTVLTACSTNAPNRRSRGGPVQSVALAAMMAGASNVLATLWDVSDTAAYAFSDRFYSELVQGQTVREATRNAKLALRRDPFWQAPKFWAAFQPWIR